MEVGEAADGGEVVVNRKVLQRRHNMANRLQGAYRMRLSRRILWRKKKVWVHQQETRAAVAIQCAMRVYLANKRVRRQRALVQYLQFVNIVRPGVKNMRPEEMEVYAAVHMQAAWRRRQAIQTAKMMKGAKVYYTKLRAKHGNQISFDQVHDIAASKMQAIWKGNKARRVRAELKREKDVALTTAAAIRIQKRVRGMLARKKATAEKNERKMRRLGGFFRNGCFLKCWMIWIRFTDQAVHFKEVVGRTLGRWLNMGKVRGFNALQMYAEAKKDKRQKVQKAAFIAAKKETGPRDRIWGYWADYMDDLRELWSKVQAKCSSFLHLLTGDFVKLAFSEWKEVMMKDRKAKKRRTNYMAFQGWKGWRQYIDEKKHFRDIQAKIQSRWQNVMMKEHLFDFKDSVDDMLYHRSLVGDAVLCWMNKTVIHAFRALDEHAQIQLHYKRTVATFRRRYQLRGVLPIARAWREIAADKAEKKRILRQAAFQVYKRLITGCWGVWRDTIRDRKLAEREMAAKGSKTLMRIAKRPMAISFEHWSKWWAHQKRNRQIFARIAFRWRNANVVLTFNNWIVFVDLAIHNRRLALREAVLEAMQKGNLQSLLATARQQKRNYQRATLEEVMKQILEEEHVTVHNLVSHDPHLHPRGPPTDPNAPTDLASVMQRKKLSKARTLPGPQGGRRGSMKAYASPPKARPGKGRTSRDISPNRDRDGSLAGLSFTSMDESMPAPDMSQVNLSHTVSAIHGPGASTGSKKSLSQILPPYLRGEHSGSEIKGKEYVKYSLSDSTNTNYAHQQVIDPQGQGEALERGVWDALGTEPPGENYPFQAISVGETTAYPLLGFDAELPQRSTEAVKLNLNNFEMAAKKESGSSKKKGILPPIKKAKANFPTIDDAAEMSVGMTGSIDDAAPDVTLPPVNPAPIAMPAIIDE